jgi:eukaryotic-like serine/threonine-protein kinase
LVDEPQSDTELQIGALIDNRYRVVRRLGEGGMGAVYEAEHVLIKRRVAVKCLLPELARDRETVQRFHREAMAATAIGNEHIIDVLDMGALPSGAAYMVLEFLDGRDLEQELRRAGPMPLDRVLHIVWQICDALGAAHAKGIIHRDLKPANIFLIPRGGDPDFVKVLDFGISKFIDAGDTGLRTKTGMAIGTPVYMPIEQFEGRRTADHRIDLYALGVITYRALAGRLPFDADGIVALFAKVVLEPPAPLARLRPELPPQVCEAVHRLLARSPDDRFPSCAALQEALRPWRSSGISAPAISTPAPDDAVAPTFLRTPEPTAQLALAALSSTRQKRTAAIIAFAGAVGAALWFSHDREAPVDEAPLPTPVTAPRIEPQPSVAPPMEMRTATIAKPVSRAQPRKQVKAIEKPQEAPREAPAAAKEQGPSQPPVEAARPAEPREESAPPVEAPPKNDGVIVPPEKKPPKRRTF